MLIKDTSDLLISNPWCKQFKPAYNTYKKEPKCETRYFRAAGLKFNLAKCLQRQLVVGNNIVASLYMKELQRHFGKVAVVMDRASPHRAKAVKELLRENKSIKIIYLPKGSPYLNAVEECWRQGKQVLLVSEYYRTFADLCSAIITYYRTLRFKLDIFKFAHRRATALCTN